MLRCLVCGSSKVNQEYSKCLVCGAAAGDRDEECYVSNRTKATFLAHADELASFGVTLDYPDRIAKRFSVQDFELAMEIAGLAITVVDSARKGSIRDFLVYLQSIHVPKDDILRLRLDEPEVIDMLDRDNPK